MRAHTVDNRTSEAFTKVTSRAWIQCARRQYFSDTCKLSRLMHTVRIYPLGVAGGQGADLSIKRKRRQNTTEQMKPNNSRRFRIARDVIACQQRFHLRGKTERPSIICRVHRLDTVWVTCQENTAPKVVPDGEGKHPAQSINHFGTVARIKMK